MELFRIDGDAFDAFKRKMSNEPIPLKNLDLYSDPRTNYRTPGYGGGYGGPPRGDFGPYRGGRYEAPSRYNPYEYSGGYSGYGKIFLFLNLDSFLQK